METKEKVPALIVTSKVYSKDSFIREAMTEGVNRVVNPDFAKKLNWGSCVLLCAFTPYQKRGTKTTSTGKKVPVGTLMGDLEIFGYFVVKTLSVNVSAEKLGISYSVVSTEPKFVRRQCGSYLVTAVYQVESSIKEIVERAESVAREMGIKLRVMIGGDYHALNFPKVLQNVSHTRGVRYFEVEISSEMLKEGLLLKMESYIRTWYCAYCGRPVLRKKCVEKDGKIYHKKCYAREGAS